MDVFLGVGCGLLEAPHGVAATLCDHGNGDGLCRRIYDPARNQDHRYYVGQTRGLHERGSRG